MSTGEMWRAGPGGKRRASSGFPLGEQGGRTTCLRWNVIRGSLEQLQAFSSGFLTPITIGHVGTVSDYENVPIPRDSVLFTP